MSKTQAICVILWDVILNGETIDRAFYYSNMTKKDVLRDLIEKGYDSAIKIKKGSDWR